MYNLNGSIPYEVTIPQNKSFMIYFENDDVTDFTLPNDEKLRIVLTQDLYYKQSFELIVDANSTATQNKKLEIYVKYLYGDSESAVMSQLLETIDLPVYYNTSTQLLNIAANSTRFNFNIDLNKLMTLEVGNKLFVPIEANGGLVSNTIKKGDTLLLTDFVIGTVSTLDFSDQYKVDSVGLTNSYVYLDVSTNKSIVNYGASQSLPLILNNSNSYLLSDYPYFRLNKGAKYRITRVLSSNFTSISERYFVEKKEL